MGVELTFQLFPPSVERNTRAAGPPVTNQAFLFPMVVTQVLLAANAPSPSRAGGIFWGSEYCQVFPPLTVRRIWNLPFTGSPTMIPRSGLAKVGSKNAMQSKNPLGSGLVNCKSQCSPKGGGG